MSYFSDLLDFDFTCKSGESPLGFDEPQLLPDGKAIIAREACACRYVGEINSAGLPHGFGIVEDCGHEIERDGLFLSYYQDEGDTDRFEGHFDNGIRNGNGTYYSADGSVLKGYWNNGTVENGELSYFYFLPDGSKFEYKYTGSFQEVKEKRYAPAKFAKIEYSNGEIYEGEIKGNWDSLIKDGSGTLIDASGNTITGYWCDDELVYEGEL